MTKLTLGIMVLFGLSVGLFLALPVSSVHAAAEVPDAAARASLSQALSLLKVALDQAQAAIGTRSASELSGQNWVAINQTLGNIRFGLGNVNLALGNLAGGTAAQNPVASPQVNPAPSPVAEQNPAPAAEAPNVTNDQSPSREQAASPPNRFSWVKTLIAIVILLGGGILIAFSLRGPKTKSSVSVKTEAVQESLPLQSPATPPDSPPPAPGTNEAPGNLPV